MAKKLHLIRGQRILNQLEQLVETSFNVLRQNAKKIPSGDRESDALPIVIRKIELTPYEGSSILQIDTEASSPPNSYKGTIVFQDVDFQDENEPMNITFTGSDGDEYHMAPISLGSVNVKVSCECLDFYWRFAYYNSRDNSLHGNPPPPYQKKTNSVPVNPQKVPGVCKHLIKAVEELKQSGVVTN